jgi:hypothetical protein
MPKSPIVLYISAASSHHTVNEEEGVYNGMREEDRMKGARVGLSFTRA